MTMRTHFPLNASCLGMVLTLCLAQAASAISYVDGRRFIEADSGAFGPGEADSDDPPAIDVMGTTPVFDDTTTSSAAISAASASSSASQYSELAFDGIEASGTYLADASADEGFQAAGSATNDFSVSFVEDTGSDPTFTLTGTLDNFDAAGSSAFLSFAGPGVFEQVSAQGESQPFSFSGTLQDAGEYTLIVELQGSAAAEPPFGDPAQSSNGAFDLVLTVLPEPGGHAALAWAVTFLAALSRHRLRA